MNTKSCNLTEGEIVALLVMHGDSITEDIDFAVERINYLNKRLKAFKEVDVQTAKPDLTKPEPSGWGTN